MENQSFTVFRLNLSRFISGQLAKPRFLFFHHEFSYSYVHTQPHVIPIERRGRSIGSIRVNMPEVIPNGDEAKRKRYSPPNLSPLFSSLLYSSSFQTLPFRSSHSNPLFFFPPFSDVLSKTLPSSGKRGKRSELRGRVRLTASRRVTVRGGREEEAGKRRAR